MISSCSNTHELETGEIKIVQLFTTVLEQSGKPEIFVNARDLLTREQIDKAAVPILYVELETGQNGTLTPYPGQGDGQTWLGADGATITLDEGILKASRGMGSDIMGANSSMPLLAKHQNNEESYTRNLYYLSGNNKIVAVNFKCTITKSSKRMV